MPTLNDLGRAVKQRYPGVYDDLGDAELGQRIQQRFPGAYDDYQGTEGGPQTREEMRAMMQPDFERLNQMVEQGTGMGTDVLAETQGQQIGAQIGGALGSLRGPTGRAVGQGLGRVLGGGASALASGLLQRQARGESFDPTTFGHEALLTFLPEGIESGVRFGLRQSVKRLPGSQELRMNQAVDESIRTAPSVFNAPGRKASSALFKEVEDSGIQLDTADLSARMNALGKRRLNDVARLDLATMDTKGRTGGRYVEMFERLRNNDPVSIGELQDLRSVLWSRSRKASPEAARTLEAVAVAVDDAIDTAPLRAGAGVTPDMLDTARATLAQARDNWKRSLAAENLADILGTSPVSRVDRGGNILRFNFNALLNELRDNRRPRARELNRSLKAIPGASANFETFKQNLKAIAPGQIRLTNTQGLSRLAFVAVANNALADLMTTKAGQNVLQEGISKGRGVMSVNTLAALANATRQAMERESEGETMTPTDIVNMVMGRTQFPETAR